MVDLTKPVRFKNPKYTTALTYVAPAPDGQRHIFWDVAFRCTLVFALANIDAYIENIPPPPKRFIRYCVLYRYINTNSNEVFINWFDTLAARTQWEWRRTQATIVKLFTIDEEYTDA